MSIRYRLLLIVGLVATVVFLSAFALNNRLLERNIRIIRGEAEGFIEDNIETRRENVEKFLFDNMTRKLAQINALLETISQFSSLSDWFAPTSDNLRLGTWSHAAHFLQDEDWVRFLQNTSDSKLLSLIVPEEGPFFRTQIASLGDGISWVFVSKSAAYSEPYLGIQLPFKTKEDPLAEDTEVVVSGNLPTVFALYTLDKLKALSFSSDFLQSKGQSIPEPSIEGYEIDEEKFYDFLVRAIELVKNSSLEVPERKKIEATKTEELPLSERYQSQILDYSYELFLVGEITSLQRAQFFGSRADSLHWPDGISFVKQDSDQGAVFFLDSIIGFSKPVFDDQAFFKKHPPQPGSFVSSGSYVMKSPRPNQAFFVNTAAFYSGVGDLKKQSLLTIGFDMTELLQDLVSISGLYGCMISGNQVLTQISPKGAAPVHFDLIPKLLSEQSSLKGFFHLGDTEYVFLRGSPMLDMDFYFCFFLPKEEFFNLFLKVQERVRMIIYHTWIQRLLLGLCSLVILWVLLLDLSKKITKPIIALSNALRHVKGGEWDLIKLPPIQSQKNNEIKQLLSSFQDMVEGMKEKEKMSGILNKVVSKEIAQEILKGDVHLGGEEKEVTMLFADIRGFTKLTQNMEPQDIINLLNMCMTKLSRVIEENKGVIDKYLGDGIMALYGAPISYKESALYSVISGMEMISIIQKWDEERIKAGQPPLDIGIGIHTGTVCAGNMGALNRLNYTVIGSHVNMASRLCYTAGPGELLITADTYEQPSVRQNIEVEDKGFMAFKGFDEKKQVYKVLGLKNPDIGKFLVLEGID